jgi:hypothetical protein
MPELYYIVYMRLFLSLCVVFFVSGAVPVQAQVTIEQLDPHNFGEIIADPSGDAVRVRPGGNIRQTGASDLQGGHSNARFRIRGAPNETISYSFSAGDTVSGDGQTLVLEDIVANRSNPFTLNGSGLRNLRVGATLVIPPGFQGGNLSGSFTVTIDNQ